MHRARPIILDRNIKYKEVSDMNNNNEEACDEEDQGYNRVTAVPVMLLSDATSTKELSDSDGDDQEYCC